MDLNIGGFMNVSGLNIVRRGEKFWFQSKMAVRNSSCTGTGSILDFDQATPEVSALSSLVKSDWARLSTAVISAGHVFLSAVNLLVAGSLVGIKMPAHVLLTLVKKGGRIA